MDEQRRMMEELSGFMRSRAILTAAELDLFSRLDEKEMTAAELAGAAGTDERALTRVLDCLVAWGLLQKGDGRYRTAGLGTRLSARHPESMLPMALHLNAIWGNWSGLTEAVRRGSSGIAGAAGTAEPGGEREAFIGAMHAVARPLAARIAGDYDAGRFEKLLDVGGGSGAYTIAFLEKNPRMHAVLFDLAEVIPIARRMIGATGLEERVTFAAGDFYADDLPHGCDLALLSAIIHQNSPAQNLDLYRKIQRALAPGGVLLIRDHVMDFGRIDPPAGALFALNMLVNTEGGDTYTFDEVKSTLEEAGFGAVAWVRRGGQMDSLVEARKTAE